MVCLSVADPDLQIRVQPDSEIRGGSRGWEGGEGVGRGGGGAVLKNFFSALLASVWSKNKGRLASQAPPLGAPLSMQGFCQFTPVEILFRFIFHTKLIPL